MSAIAAQSVVIGVLWRRFEKGLEQVMDEHRRCEDQLQEILVRLTDAALPVERRSQVIVGVPNPGRRMTDV